MTFQIVRIIPTRCPSTDAFIGSRAEPLPMAYTSQALAERLAGRWGYQDYLCGGEDCFTVVPYGGSPYPNRLMAAPMPVADHDGMPF